MNSSNDQTTMVPVILSGGSGTRLWPVSRRAHPKPFMKLVDGESLAEKTFRRALGVVDDGPVLTVTSRDYYFYTRDLYVQLVGDDQLHPFLLEPVGRNTAPAIALAAYYLQQVTGPETVMLSLSASTPHTRKRVTDISEKANGLLNPAAMR
jgi:mannose-1-phosphate guanylyltransferase/mannose-6-phosphate isomerase